MTQEKWGWTLTAYMATTGAFIVLCLVSISDSRLGILRSKQQIQLSELGLASIAPSNLPGAAEMFRLRVASQAPGFPVEEMVQLKAWHDLQANLAAYAERLRLLDAQNRELDRQLQRRSIWTSWAALACVLVSLGLLLLRPRQKAGGSLADNP